MSRSSTRRRRPAEPPGSPRWEVMLLHRPGPGRRARVAGRLEFGAADAEGAREAAEQALQTRAGGEPNWSLGVLRPLSPRAPGTRLYRVTFAQWTADGEGYVRRDVHALDLWAADAAGARRLAQAEIAAVPGYRPTWRIRSVARAGADG